jgi:N-acetyl-anhydromuramyl-L-alanine amidase AmpD
MSRKKTAALIIALSFLTLGGFFVIRKLDFNGNKVIRAKKEQNIDNQNKVANETENNSNAIQPNDAENPEEVTKNNIQTDNSGKNGQQEEKTANSIKIIDKLVSWGYQKSSNRSIDTIIIHSSYNALGGDQYSVEKLIGEYREYGVSPHYLVDRSGNIFRLVQDKDIAYHAGEGQTPDKRTNVNNFSIGIEMMNTKSDEYTEAQYSALKDILAYLKEKYDIKYTLGHKDIAKNRKDDPWNFNWNKIK